MTKKHSTKKALVASVLSLLLCFSMLIGTTFAWFTDSVTSANNIIKSGNLDVELYYQAEGQTDWTKVTNITNVFKENALWEPGHTEVVKLKVVNEGTLALKYQLGVNVASEVGSINVNNEEFKLSEFIKFGIVDGAQSYTRDQAIAAAEANGATALKTAYNSTVTALDAKNDTDSDEKIVTMVVYMPTTVGNDANAKTGAAVPTINLGINLVATQMTAESDSFNDQYDKDAEFSVDVKNADELADMLKVGGKVKLVGDIQLSNSVEVSAGVEVELDLNGKTITGTKGRDADNNRIHVIVNNGILTIKDGTVKSAGNDGGSAIYNNAGATLTIEDVTLYGAPQSDPVYEAGVSKPYPSYAVNNYGNAVVNGATIKSYHGAIATGDNGVTVVNDADIDVGLGQSTGITSYAIYSYENAQVTVNGGKFAFTKQEIYVNGGNTFCELGTNPIIVNGGNYIGTSFSTGAGREYVIKGGTFDADPSTYVADGYIATKNADGTYTVVKGATVANVADLTNAIANGGNIVLTEDIAITNTLMTTKDVVIDLNGNSITAPSNGNMFHSQSNASPDITITSSVPGAVINVSGGDTAVLLGYGSTEIKNVTINITGCDNYSPSPFNVYGDLTIGEGTVVNVDYLGSALISNNGAVNIVIDGATFNIGTFKRNGVMIDLNNATTFEMKNTTMKINNYVLSQFGGEGLIKKIDGVTIENCTFDITDSNGASCTFVADAGLGRYDLVQK